MSGHNKWSKIKHKKAASDAQKSKVFSKHAQIISIESRNAKGDVNSPGLKAAIERAKKDSMPSANIERAVKKGTGGEAGSLEKVSYEAYGPGGSALIIEGVTDNRNRTAAEIKHLLGKFGLSLAEPGAASWAFEKTQAGWEAKTTIPLSPEDSERFGEIVETIEDHDDIQEVYTNAD